MANEPISTIKGKVMPLPHTDVDTDQIIPAEYLKVTNKDGLVEGLFKRWRYDSAGQLNPDFPLNKPEYQDAEVLLAGDHFGSGSSREHAPWALVGWGFKAIVSTSFADIFRNNALKNGLLPVIVDEETHQELFDMTDEVIDVQVTIDLEQQTITLPNGKSVHFPIDAFSKSCLLQGVDQLGFLLGQENKIAAFEQAHGK